jgi:hypothetical protein
MNNDQIREAYRALRKQSAPRDVAIQSVAGEVGKSPADVQAIIDKRPPSSFVEIPPFKAYATSTLYRLGVEEDNEGNLIETRDGILQWVKEGRNNERLVAEELIKSLAEGLPKVKSATSKSQKFRNDTVAVYPMGDPHFGMFSWGEESGEDFDLKIAERDLCSAVDRLVDTVPACDEALIVNLGDFFHADNQAGTTTKGTTLDTDTRWAKVLRVGVKAIRQCIESALRKHNHVTVINAIGNHDEHTAMFLSVALLNIYENEPRVTIIANPTIKHYYRFGKNLIGVHHGHTIKMQDLPFQMAVDRAQDWAETQFRYFLTGHIHHDSKKEVGGVIVESFRTLAAKDAWHTSMGYHAGRDMKAILFHKEFGEVERHTVSVEMIREYKN